MFRSSTRCNRFTSLLLTLAPLHFSSNLPSEAFLISAKRSHKYLATSGSGFRLQYSGYETQSIRCHTTSLSITDAELDSDLAQKIHESYEAKETDGVLELALTQRWMIDSKLDIEGTLIPAILQVSASSKGVASSIMNALIGSSCVFTTPTENTESKSVGDPVHLQNHIEIDGENLNLMSSRILLLMEALQETGDIVPDVVTYSLAYRALSTDPDCATLADTVLEEAERRSKKIAGGKRRKLLASARRQKVSTFVDAEDTLKGILGDDFQVLLETDGFAVVNKPSGIPCFHKKKTTAGKIKRGAGKNKKSKKSANSLGVLDISLEDALISCNVNLSTLNPEALGLVHRLDRGSSGCIVLAKTNEMHATLVSEFFLRRTTKKYVALVRESPTSSIPEDGSGLIESPVNGRPARSQYRILERYESFSEDESEDSEDSASLLEFEIFTGRKHQIRVHAAEILGSPVWGDPLYGNNDGDTSKRIFLHACHLTIPQLNIDVESPLPKWWQPTLSAFKSKPINYNR